MSTKLYATELIIPEFKKKVLTVNIVHAEPFDFDTFVLTNRFNKQFTLVCSGNPFYGNKSSYLEYENFFGSHVADFKFKQNVACHVLKEHLYAVFEGVNRDNQIQIFLNRESGLVEKIILPPIDPLYDGEEHTPLEDIRELAKL